MSDRAQQPPIDSRQAGQASGIHSIILLIIGKNQLHFAGIRHDHVVAALLDYAAGPARMHPHLQRYQRPRHSPEICLEAARTGADILFTNGLAHPVQNAYVTSSIPQIDADRKALA